jgi:uncharacterized protein YcbK (DUF882 family)
MAWDRDGAYSPSRRHLLFGLGGSALAAALPAGFAEASAGAILPPTRALQIEHFYLNDRVGVVYFANGRYVPAALERLDNAMRDTFDKSVSEIDPRLYDYMFAVQRAMQHSGPIKVYSAYRSPETNAKLRAKSRGVAKNSFHMRGQAVDIALPGRDLRPTALAAKGLKMGGVGFYSRNSKFVHIDTGDVRSWNI